MEKDRSTGVRSRRGFLAAVGALSAVGVTGCVGGEGGGSGGESGTQLSEHPIGEGLSDWPFLGADPFEASATVVALDDPSCPRCAAFHEDTVPEIEANLVQDGGGSFVNRPYPVVYDWGPPAAQSLEAVFDRDEEVFWDLQAFYFENQSDFGTGNVLERTEGWLDENTDLDGGGVVEDVRNDEYGDRIQATLDAAEAAEAGQVTPVVYMFRDGELRSVGTGRVSYTTIENALQL
jgi:protein-disulfide isomerase